MSQQTSADFIINQMNKHGFHIEVSINPVWEEEKGVVAKELTRSIKLTKVKGDDLATVLKSIWDHLTPTQETKLKKAIWGLVERKTDESSMDRDTEWN